MVLANNKWLNNCENEQKTIVTTNATATNSTSTTTANTMTSNNSTSIPTATATTTATLLNDTTILSSNNLNQVSINNVTNKTTTAITTVNETNNDTSDDGLNENDSDYEEQIQAQYLLLLQNDEEKEEEEQEKKHEIAQSTSDYKIANIIETKTALMHENLIEDNNKNNNNKNNTTEIYESTSNSNTLQGKSSNWTNNNAQSTENYLNSLGVDISGLEAGIDTNSAKQFQTSSFFEGTKLGGNNNNNNSIECINHVLQVVSSANTNNTENNETQAKIVLTCEPNSHPFQTRIILLTPNIECKVGRLIAKSKASEANAIFDCKVLSRNHAVIWYTPEDSKFWVKDTKSSNGTFINENKLGNEAAELHFGDIVKFGVDVLENSRKEIHGCVIASVKLYLPDGREAISIDPLHAQRSPYSGENRISFDELHRLNLYVQEVAQREKNLKSKMFNIQNILDTTRKNSGLCWQALITEDHLLYRIHMLEKKLQIMEKNVPESLLRSEVII